jgi:thioredoxin reductase (NADPH)
MEPLDCIVIGGGISGLTASHFLIRAGLTTIILDHDKSIVRKAQLRNLPGISPISGNDYLNNLKAQVRECPQFKTKVSDIRSEKDYFAVDADDRSDLRSRYIVLATGATPIDFPSTPLEKVTGRQPFVKYNIPVDRDFETAIPGLFAVGILAGVPSQAVIAAGSGATAAITIASRIKGEFWVDHDDLPNWSPQ